LGLIHDQEKKNFVPDQEKQEFLMSCSGRPGLLGNLPGKRSGMTRNEYCIRKKSQENFRSIRNPDQERQDVLIFLIRKNQKNQES